MALMIIAQAQCVETTNAANPKWKTVAPCAPLVSAARANSISIEQTNWPSGTNSIHPGDCATVLVTFAEKEKRTQWLLYLEATTPDPQKPPQKPAVAVVNSSFGPPIRFESIPVPATLRLIGPFAANGETKQPKVSEKDADFLLNEGFLGIGLEQAAALLWRWSQRTNFEGAISSKALLSMNPTPAEQRALCGTFPAMFSYVNIVQHTEGLEDLFYKLVELPSVWSVIRHVGVTANISFGNKAMPSPADPAEWNFGPTDPVYYFPFLLRLNDRPALKITLVVASPREPLLICGGVVGLLAEKIDDENTYMSLRLVSAGRKPGKSAN